MIRLVSRQILADTAAERWKAYYVDTGRPRGEGVDTEEIHRRLVSLGPSPHPKEVEEIIGDQDFTLLGVCLHCHKKRKELVEIEFGVGELCDQVRLCKDCLIEAVEKFP
jgi:hypothetical protein